MHPNGDESYIWLYLHLKASNSLKFSASYRLGIMSKAVEKSVIYPGYKTGEQFKSLGLGYGSELINHAKLFDPNFKFFVNEKLTLRCEVSLTFFLSYYEPNL